MLKSRTNTQSGEAPTSTSRNSARVLLTDLKECSRTRNLERGKRVHAEAVTLGQASNIYVVNSLIDMYAKCGSMVDARQLFESIHRPNVVSWTALMLGYADNGEGHASLHLFIRMKDEGLAPDSVTFMAVLKACASVAVKGGARDRAECRKQGSRILDLAVENACDSDVKVQNTFIDMYSKCGSMVDAHQVFCTIKHPDVVTWNVLITGYADNGQGDIALDLLKSMRNTGLAPDSLTFVAALKACVSLAEISECKKLGEVIHDLAVEDGYNSDTSVQNNLIDMYASCGSMRQAYEVFDSLKLPDVVSWTVLILGYTENGEGLTALEMFRRMATSVDGGASEWAECRRRSKLLCNLAEEENCSSNVKVQNTLIDLYCKCGSMWDARQVFDGIEHPQVVSWTVVIQGYADNGQGDTALELFREMRSHGLAPEPLTFVAAMKACTSLKNWVKCRERLQEIHNLAVENGCDSDMKVQNTLIDMYAKCGTMVCAQQVFESIEHPDIVSWTVLIMGYADNGQGLISLDHFRRMRSDGPSPNSVTLVAALKACTSLTMTEERLACRDRGRTVHNLVVDIGTEPDIYLQSTLIDMYAKCDCMVDARQVFNSIKHPDVVSWSALVLGYAEAGQGFISLDLFMRMRSEGPAPNSVTLMAALKACGLVGGLEFGKTLHAELDRDTELDVILVTCLVDFYAKCGSLVEAQSVFDAHAESRNMVTWTALLAGFSNCGDHQAVFKLFEGMQDAGLVPDSVAFVCILACCKHAGLLEKAKECFDAMPLKYGVLPTIEHYSCMVDILGRSNKLDDAMALLRSMHCNPNDVTWTAVLCACREWKNVEIGRLAFHSFVELNQRDMAAYLLMGQIYGSRGMLQEQAIVMGMNAELTAACYKQGETFWTNELGAVHIFFDHDQVQSSTAFSSTAL